MRETCRILSSSLRRAFLCLALGLSFPAHADAQENAVLAGAADCISTGAALSLGFAELNPINPAIACLVVKPFVMSIAERQPEPARTATLHGASAIWTGAAVNNGLAILGAGAAAPVFGVMVAVGLWASGAEEREFMRLCAIHKALDPRVTTCVYRRASTH